MRPSALPNLLIAAQKNADRGRGDVKLFEAGPAYLGDGENDQIRTISAIWRARPQRHWQGAKTADVFDIKRECLAVLDAVGAPSSLQTATDVPGWLHPGRGGALKLGNKAVAWFGEVHPRVLKTLAIDGPVLAFEINLDALPAPRAKASKAKPALEKLDLMPLSRDFAFLVDEAKPAADLVRAAYGADKQLIADVALFDVYRGQGVPEGKKSLAIEVTLQPREKTLAEADIEAVSARIVSAVMKATGGALRG
jgi:phenylalanyl-tRNA synthetase beta chain